MKVSATHKTTGETIEHDVNNIVDMVNAWRLASEYEKLAMSLKEQLKKMLPPFLDESGNSEEVGGYVFKSRLIHRRNYDKTIMRQVLDEDTFDLLLIPDKTKIDAYIKENMNSLGDISTKLRETMVDVGRPYNVTRLERLDRYVTTTNSLADAKT